MTPLEALDNPPITANFTMDQTSTDNQGSPRSILQYIHIVSIMDKDGVLSSMKLPRSMLLLNWPTQQINIENMNNYAKHGNRPPPVHHAILIFRTGCDRVEGQYKGA